MKREYRCFIAKGRSLEIIQECIALRDEANEQFRALLEDLGAENARAGPYIAGFFFKGKPPQGWKPIKGDSKCFLPPKTTKEFRELRKRIDAVRWPAGLWLSMRLGCGEVWTPETGVARDGWTGNVILYPWFEFVTGHFIIHMPVKQDGTVDTPPGAELIRNSLYWQMAEEQEERDAKPKAEQNPRIRIANQDLFVDDRWVTHIWVSGKTYGTTAAGQNFSGKSLIDVAEQVVAHLDNGGTE